MPFNGIDNLRDSRDKVEMKMWMLDEIKKCVNDPIYFIEHYVYINTLDNGFQLMKLYPYQKEAILRFLKYRFNINKWSRQVGKSTVVRAFILWFAVFMVGKGMLIGNVLGIGCSATSCPSRRNSSSSSVKPTWPFRFGCSPV